MRDTDPIEPMWETGAEPGITGRAWGVVATVSAGLLRRLAPHVSGWARGQRPSVIVGWGASEYRLGRRVATRRRADGPGWDDNPRSNYNEAVRKKQERVAAKEAAASPPAPAEDPARVADLEAALKKAESNAKSAWTRVKKANARVKELEAEASEAAAAAADAAPSPAVDLSEDAMKAEVAAAMGMDAGGSDDAAEVSRDPDALKDRLSNMRATLQALDDVADWDLLEAADDELYKLHKAVEYKLRNHKASEAKAKLDGLFKQSS